MAKRSAAMPRENMPPVGRRVPWANLFARVRTLDTTGKLRLPMPPNFQLMRVALRVGKDLPERGRIQVSAGQNDHNLLAGDAG